jgi:hypothetical protein
MVAKFIDCQGYTPMQHLAPIRSSDPRSGSRPSHHRNEVHLGNRFCPLESPSPISSFSLMTSGGHCTSRYRNLGRRSVAEMRIRSQRTDQWNRGLTYVDALQCHAQYISVWKNEAEQAYIGVIIKERLDE